MLFDIKILYSLYITINEKELYKQFFFLNTICVINVARNRLSYVIIFNFKFNYDKTPAVTRVDLSKEWHAPNS